MGRVLVTGFERFGPNDLNPSALLMDRLAGREGVVTAVLPVEYHACVTRFESLLDLHKPDAAIAFGLARSSDHIRPERVALNLDEAAAPDNAGITRHGLRIVPDGPVGYWSTLPVDRIVTALRAAGLPAAASGHAGGYVCNHLFYGVRHGLDLRGSAMPMGFIHVPPLPEQVAGETGRMGLNLDTLQRGALIVLDEVRRICG
ncbi:pyrrolidone-carboxylate peptidase [Skermanella stibiiresistens SB22]|uniref:Pyrrolidone-carboxylate peptidase n=1 Tax=Skermanella stibiiresistens SB22 TaxID=1385369 RepID=W9H323_9PROT|nr:pyrrolidone-carboxylate peptidase [Skermanella stibiiresistens]EWY40474.1 pyrrolidone-carboxylate peptidase [Skermanella stibiiresistens SB22]